MSDSVGNAPSAIGVWHSDDFGVSWVGPAIVASEAGGSYIVDKPTIAVSWYAGAGSTLGWLYVAWTHLDTSYTRNPNNTSNSVFAALSTDGGVTFPTQAMIAYGDVSRSMPVPNKDTGELMYTWVDNLNNEIRACRAQYGDLRFGAHEIINNEGGLLTWRTGVNLFGVRASTVPQVRYNWISHLYEIVWHARSSSGDADAFLSYYPCQSQCNGFGWRTRITVNDTTYNDQFMPAVDYNTSGYVIVTYYDRREDTVTPNLLYNEYMSYLTGYGVRQQIDRNVSGFASNPSNYAASGRNNFIGDYQDIWNDTYTDGQSASSVWIGIQGAEGGDVWLSRIFN